MALITRRWHWDEDGAAAGEDEMAWLFELRDAPGAELAAVRPDRGRQALRGRRLAPRDGRRPARDKP